MYREIGAYFELELFGCGEYHTGAVLLNSARNALRYIIRVFSITALHVPYYTCPVVWDAVNSENCEILFYDIDEDFMPAREFDDDAFVLANNYFGVCDDNMAILSRKYRNLIVDDAQSFYSKSCGLASFYSPRKFFGLPDGGMLLCDRHMEERFERDTSYERMAHLLKRHDLGARGGYEDFKDNDGSLAGQPVKMMSRLTKALMQNINYEHVRKVRNENFNFMHDKLGGFNELRINSNANGDTSSTANGNIRGDIKANINTPMVYPLLMKSEGLRGKLLSRNIYIARYWDGIERAAPAGSRAIYLKDNLLPLPIDQRYSAEDMSRIAGAIADGQGIRLKI
ncbi:MAG: hypothetical protein LBL49_01995 [Clostridiales Family XIII bacterium]|nr:hypothetical protein [Clostridiales Family XIII bacterium]